ncbi:hypothetical protein AK812_SmicGene12185 [Symbiodinium microadriaticum]|uniref:Uncharacterized protein n=1 Tax=Symbiodinium microadriaticum TaxID=2951 RepID=A0A1Q9EB98_SYMMI|nr:hypothetical protein AK812_SmicGene12185 [Symbiodinium microadriaticum]
METIGGAGKVQVERRLQVAAANNQKSLLVPSATVSPLPFFNQHKFFLLIEVLSSTPQVFTKWTGWIELSPKEVEWAVPSHFTTGWSWAKDWNEAYGVLPEENLRGVFRMLPGMRGSREVTRFTQEIFGSLDPSKLRQLVKHLEQIPPGPHEVKNPAMDRNKLRPWPNHIPFQGLHNIPPSFFMLLSVNKLSRDECPAYWYMRCRDEGPWRKQVGGKGKP